MLCVELAKVWLPNIASLGFIKMGGLSSASVSDYPMNLSKVNANVFWHRGLSRLFAYLTKTSQIQIWKPNMN